MPNVNFLFQIGRFTTIMIKAETQKNIAQSLKQQHKPLHWTVYIL